MCQHQVYFVVPWAIVLETIYWYNVCFYYSISEATQEMLHSQTTAFKKRWTNTDNTNATYETPNTPTKNKDKLQQKNRLVAVSRKATRVGAFLNQLHSYETSLLWRLIWTIFDIGA